MNCRIDADAILNVCHCVSIFTLWTYLLNLQQFSANFRWTDRISWICKCSIMKFHLSVHICWMLKQSQQHMCILVIDMLNGYLVLWGQVHVGETLTGRHFAVATGHHWRDLLSKILYPIAEALPYQASPWYSGYTRSFVATEHQQHGRVFLDNKFTAMTHCHARIETASYCLSFAWLIPTSDIVA